MLFLTIFDVQRPWFGFDFVTEISTTNMRHCTVPSAVKISVQECNKMFNKYKSKDYFT